MPNSVKLKFVREHRSIKALPDTDLPNFAVITGPNGCGKTQLLEAIAQGAILAEDQTGKELSSKIFFSKPELSASNVDYNNLQNNKIAALDTKYLILDLEECLNKGLRTQIHIDRSWKPLDRITLMKVLTDYLRGGPEPNFRNEDADKFQSALYSGSNRRSRLASFRTFSNLKPMSSLNEFNGPDVWNAIDNYIQHETFMNIDVSAVFYRYFEEFQDNCYKRASGGGGLTNEQFAAKFGNPPWQEVNDLLSSYGFRHRFIPPSAENDPRATNGYKAMVENDYGHIFDISELSSGERIIVALLLSAYAAKQEENGYLRVEIPDLVLFDELDAHLHPSMTRMMFDVLNRSIIEKLSSRVFITTHSPSTVALSPDRSIFKLTSEASHHLQSVDAASACRSLSEGFIQLMDGSQIVIVEGKDDPLFYRAVERALRSSGELADVPTLHFIPASQTENSSSGGGAHAAEDWANKLLEARLPNVHALLDNDGQRTSHGAIKVLSGRYAIENFVLDPISIAISLITDHRLKCISQSLSNKFSSVSILYSANSDELQNLVNSICQYVERFHPEIQNPNKISTEYCNGITLDIPEWVRNRRGKDLVRIVRDSFKNIDNKYIITRKDSGEFNLELGYLLKLWSQHSTMFPVEIKNTLKLFRH